MLNHSEFFDQIRDRKKYMKYTRSGFGYNPEILYQ